MTFRLKRFIAIIFTTIGLIELTRWSLVEGGFAIAAGLILLPSWTRIIATIGLLSVGDDRSELLAWLTAGALMGVAILA